MKCATGLKLRRSISTKVMNNVQGEVGCAKSPLGQSKVVFLGSKTS